MRMLIAVCGWFFPLVAAAHGALAIGMPSSVEREGFAYGVTWDYKDQSDASDRAVKRCREEDVAAKEHCRVLKLFRRECVAITMDPDPGTPGVGWGFGATKDAAIASAMQMCHDTAGAERRAFCAVSNAECDTKP